MEIAFLDTSALVKRYHEEEHSDIINEIFKKYIIVISELSIVEFTSAINRKAVEGVITKDEVFKILNFFLRDLANFIILKFDSEVINSSLRVILKHDLKTLDSLQLAFALKIKEYNPIFISFDKKLNDAARKEGFKVINFEE